MSTQGLKRYFGNKIHAVIMMAPLKREMIRLGICTIMAIILNIILYTGVEVDGTIKPWAETPIKLFASSMLFAFMIKAFLPILGWTILKAMLLSANNAFSGILSFWAISSQASCTVPESSWVLSRLNCIWFPGFWTLSLLICPQSYLLPGFYISMCCNAPFKKQ